MSSHKDPANATEGTKKADEDPVKATEDTREEQAEEYDSLRCGYLCWRPDWLQRFNHPHFLLACVCWSTFIQGKCQKAESYTI